MNLFNFFNFIGGLALFLYGINVMGDGLKKTSGGKLEGILGKITSNRVMAVVIGALVTAVMQSSSATTVMIVGFVNSGLMELAKSVYVIMGANIGATITPWIMSLSSVGSDGSLFLQLLKPTSFAPILAIIGVFIILISKSTKRKNLALIFVGFAVLIFGMETMSDSIEPLSESESFSHLMMIFKNPLIGTFIGILLTAVIQSSSATVGMIQVLSTAGLITYGSAIPLMIGANIGTCATALLSSIGTSRNARRSALIHLFYNIIRGVLFFIVFYSLNMIFRFAFLDRHSTAVGIAFFYTCLSIASAIVLFPIGNLILKPVYLTLPVTEEEKELKGIEAKRNIKLLDERFLASPGLAIAQSKQVAVDMAKHTRNGLFTAIDLLTDYKEKKAKKVVDLEDVVDHYEDELGNYLVKLGSQPMSHEDSTQLSIILHSIGDFERISDHAVNIMETAREKAEKGLRFSKKAEEELNVYTTAVKDIVTMAFDAFEKTDRPLAANVEPIEEVIDNLNQDIKTHHIKRLRKGKCSIEMGFILSDLLNNYERVSDHCSNIALSILQENDHIGVHEFEDEIVNKNNEEFTKLVRQFSKKYELPGRSSDGDD
ncbi:MAG: Na/Pi cotransporter family protein [Lachnospiraceae bacterium]|nr:Na/Pi cotransporter family protein [Lachnospiraceae bacterium]